MSGELRVMGYGLRIGGRMLYAPTRGARN